MSPALYLIDTSGLFRILLEFLYSARSLADRLEKRRLLRELFGWVTMNERAYDRADEVQQRLTEVGKHRSAGPSSRHPDVPEAARSTYRVLRYQG